MRLGAPTNSKRGTAVFLASESKLTPQLARKRYFEDKARDMREENDDLLDIDYKHVTRSTAFTAVMRTPEPAGVNEKNRHIIAKRKLEKEKEVKSLTSSAAVYLPLCCLQTNSDCVIMCYIVIIHFSF